MKKLLVIALTAFIAVPAMALSIGVVGTDPVVGMDMGAYTVDLGANMGTTGQTAILVKGDYKLAKVGGATPTVGLSYRTNGAAAATTVINLTVGATAAIGDASVGADIVLYQQNQVGALAATTATLCTTVVKMSLAL